MKKILLLLFCISNMYGMIEDTKKIPDITEVSNKLLETLRLVIKSDKYSDHLCRFVTSIVNKSPYLVNTPPNFNTMQSVNIIDSGNFYPALQAWIHLNEEEKERILDISENFVKILRGKHHFYRVVEFCGPSVKKGLCEIRGILLRCYENEIAKRRVARKKSKDENVKRHIERERRENNNEEKRKKEEEKGIIIYDLLK